MKGPELFGVEHSSKPCPSCVASAGFLRREMLLPVPAGARAPLSQRRDLGSICFDCASTETLRRFQTGLTWEQARIAVGNDRQEKLRLPGAPIGLPIVRNSQPGDLDRVQAWQRVAFPDEPTFPGHER